MKTSTLEPERKTEDCGGPHPGLLEPRVAAVELLPEFRRMAKRLARGDRSTQDDLVQEMALAALQIKTPQTRGTYLEWGSWHAAHYLEWWWPHPDRVEKIRRARELGPGSALKRRALAVSAALACA